MKNIVSADLESKLHTMWCGKVSKSTGVRICSVRGGSFVVGGVGLLSVNYQRFACRCDMAHLMDNVHNMSHFYIEAVIGGGDTNNWRKR
jgi:hypothetical protein